MTSRASVGVGVLLAIGAAGIADAQGQRDADRYDQTFRKYSKRYFGVGFDWRVFKAQAMAESEMNPNAKSFNHMEAGQRQATAEISLECRMRMPERPN